jgi:hypothetical protein
MRNNGHFLELLSEQPLIKSVILNLDFAKIDFTGLDFRKVGVDTYTFKDINVADYSFRSVRISISSRISVIELLTNDTAFFDDPIFYFNQEGFAHETEPIIEGDKSHIDYRRKMRAFEICGKEARLSIYKSSAYGCVINLVFL